MNPKALLLKRIVDQLPKGRVLAEDILELAEACVVAWERNEQLENMLEESYVFALQMKNGLTLLEKKLEEMA